MGDKGLKGGLKRIARSSIAVANIAGFNRRKLNVLITIKSLHFFRDKQFKKEPGNAPGRNSRRFYYSLIFRPLPQLSIMKLRFDSVAPVNQKCIKNVFRVCKNY
jgi:hypothetical protein